MDNIIDFSKKVKRRRLELPRLAALPPQSSASTIPPPLHWLMLCPEQDSNLHASQHSHLKRARLPFRHLGNIHSFKQIRAANETRTRDPNLGKVMLYQLSYCRIFIL